MKKVYLPKICLNCGKPILPEFKICPYCGENVEPLLQEAIPMKNYK